MSKMKEIEAATKELTLEERAELAGKLLLSLDEPSESDIERLWLDEAERRLEKYRQGKQESSPAEDVFRRAIADLS